jgi:hypothetical protein
VTRLISIVRIDRLHPWSLREIHPPQRTPTLKAPPASCQAWSNLSQRSPSATNSCHKRLPQILVILSEAKNPRICFWSFFVSTKTLPGIRSRNHSVPSTAADQGRTSVPATQMSDSRSENIPLSPRRILYTITSNGPRLDHVFTTNTPRFLTKKFVENHWGFRDGSS